MTMSDKLEGDERYLITKRDGQAPTVIHKAKRDGDPDYDGLEFHIVEELGNGYIVYVVARDPSQPNPNYFIHKKYILNNNKNSAD